MTTIQKHKITTKTAEPKDLKMPNWPHPWFFLLKLIIVGCLFCLVWQGGWAGGWGVAPAFKSNYFGMFFFFCGFFLLFFFKTFWAAFFFVLVLV